MIKMFSLLMRNMQPNASKNPEGTKIAGIADEYCMEMR